LFNTGSIDWNFNVSYHSTQYRTYSVTDSIPANTTYGYYASMATFYNGDHDYSIGPDGMYSMSVTQTYGGAGGTGGGGIGGGVGNVNGASGIAYSGGGGGGGGDGTCNGGSGGTGVVIISYCGSQIFTGGIVTTSGGKIIHKFTSDGVLSPAISATSSPDLNVTWYKVVPVTNAPSVGQQRVDQGTMQGGYNSIVQWNTIHQLLFATDSSRLLPVTTPWASRYSTAMSSAIYAYYHAGYPGTIPYSTGTDQPDGFYATCRQAWSTLTASMIPSSVLSNISSRYGSEMGANSQVTLYSTSNVNNNYGIMQYNGQANYFIFANDTTILADTWYGNQTGPYTSDFRDPSADHGAGNNYGLSANGPINGYVNSFDLSSINFSTQSWTRIGSGAPSVNDSTLPKTYDYNSRGGLSSPYSKFYYGEDIYIDIYNTNSNSWAASGTHTFALFDSDRGGPGGSSRFGSNPGATSIGVEVSSIPGQDWGYYFSMFNYKPPNSTIVPALPSFTSHGPYVNLTQKMLYATDTAVWNPNTDLKMVGTTPISGNSASGCSGPIS
jgi:hypothetical protein